MSAKVAVLQFPGTNCESESLRALERVGLTGEILRWNEASARLRAFDAYLLPGGFSFQDRVRAGAIAARLPLLDVVSERAAAGAPVLGLCNGAQVLVEAGLVPGNSAESAVELGLAPNAIRGRQGYYTHWVFLVPGPGASNCLFTRGLEEPVPCPMAHGEGRFVTQNPDTARRLDREVALQYARPEGGATREFPWNPNGSVLAAAGIANDAGNVLALMPHPERAQTLAQVPEDLPGSWGERRRAARNLDALEGDGPGLQLFRALRRALA